MSSAACFSSHLFTTKTLLLLLMMGELSLTRAKERGYFLAAVDIDWDYAPKGGHTTNVAHNAEFYLKGGSDRIGSIYKKTVYRLYNNENFEKELPLKSWQGIVGAIMRVEVGDTVYIKFHNMASKPYSVHPHGVLYDKLNEGAVYKGKKDDPGDQVEPGDTYEYKWEINKAAGPAQGDDACIPWPFHSHGKDPEKDINTGLIGVIIVCKPDTLNDKDERKDVNREFVVMLKVFNENHSWHTEDNLRWCGQVKKCQKLLKNGDHDFLASNYMHSVNGYLYAHGSPFSVCGGDNVIWHVMGFGGELDVHSFTIDGEVLTLGPERVISAEVLPGTFVTVAMTATAPGKKLAFCGVSSHFEEGMSAFVDVHDCGVALAPIQAGKTRKFYLMIDEVMWDYAPLGMDLYSGSPLVGEDSDKTRSKYFEASHSRIGGVYKKMMYFGYKSADFKERLYRESSDKHLGFLGPVLRVEENDILEVVLYNNGTKPFSFFPYGLLPTDPKKVDKGGLHNVAVPPKGRYAYTFTVPAGGEGAKGSPPCKTSMYQSSVDPVRDLHTGLVGALLICKKGSLDHEGNQKEGVERVLYMSVVDENLSWLIDYNIKHFTIAKKVDRHDSDFWESNRMHAVNGMMYGNLYGLEFCKWETVFWQLFSLGDESDVQGINFHGLNFEVEGRISDTVPMFPGKTITLQTKLSETGTYSIQCTNVDHFKAGMYALYTVGDCSSHDRRKRAANTAKTEEADSHLKTQRGDFVRMGVDTTVRENSSLPTDRIVEDQEEEHHQPQRNGRFIEVESSMNGDHSEQRAQSDLENHHDHPELHVDLRIEESIMEDQFFSSNEAEDDTENEKHHLKNFDNHTDEEVIKKEDSLSDVDQTAEYDPKGGHYHPKLLAFRTKFTSMAVPVENKQSTSDHYPEIFSHLFLQRDTENSIKLNEKDAKNYTRDDHLVFGNDLLSTVDFNESSALEYTAVNVTFGSQDHSTKESHTIASSDVQRTRPQKDPADKPYKKTITKLTWSAGKNSTYFHDKVKVRAHNDDAPNPEVYKAAEAKKKKKKKGEVGVRQYFIAAVELDWDYNPPWGALGNSSKRRKRSEGSSIYKKAVFQQYQDHTFTAPVKRGKADEHLGLLGPFIRAQEGEILDVVFKNLASKPFSMYAHLVAADKKNEGASYNDKSGAEDDDKVLPGETFGYKWKVTVPENQASPCFSSLYYSSHSYPKDLYTGLVGPLVICKKGVLNEEGVRGDVQKEFALLFAVFDENESKYASENLHQLKTSSNKFYSINGYTHQHIPGLEMIKEDVVAWHLLSFGSSHDVHSVNFHGQPVIVEAGGPHVKDTVGLLPEVSKDLLMTAINPGDWMIHCDVNGHMKAGEMTIYSVKDHLDPAEIEAKPQAKPVPLEKQLEKIKLAAKQQAKEAAIQAALAQLQAAAQQEAALAAAAKQAAAEAKAAAAAEAQARAAAQAEGAKLGQKAAQPEIKALQKKAEIKAKKAEELQEAKADAAGKAAEEAKASVDAKNNAGLKPVVIESKAEKAEKIYYEEDEGGEEEWGDKWEEEGKWGEVEGEKEETDEDHGDSDDGGHFFSEGESSNYKSDYGSESEYSNEYWIPHESGGSEYESADYEVSNNENSDSDISYSDSDTFYSDSDTSYSDYESSHESDSNESPKGLHSDYSEDSHESY